jgi:hypothetical protein
MIVKPGISLIAKDNIYMLFGDKSKCLIKDKKYVIKHIDSGRNTIVIDSEFIQEHHWGINDLSRVFRQNNNLSKNIKVL